MSDPVYRLVRQGDSAREGREWKVAADAYRQALALDPSLAHIWIQYGHMSKETGAYSLAASAYVEAACLRPGDPSALQWLYAIAGRMDVSERRRLADMLRSSRDYAPQASVEGKAGETVFDISDLVSYFAKARLPTGIQRVQIEAIRSLVTSGAEAIRVCCSVEGRGDWVEVPTPLFLRLAELSVLSGDRADIAWITALNTLHVDLMLADPIRFGQGATLVNLGTSWWLQNYFLQVRNAKAQFGIRYVPFVHDLIPIMTPQHCVDGLVKDFVSWIIGVFGHADGFLVASHATERDLRAVAVRLGQEIQLGRIGHVPLDADFRPPITADAAEGEVLRRYGLDGKPFVLFVSTIESRKGHTVALDAWTTLIECHGDAVPWLVCVGNDGWLNQDVYARIDASPALKAKVVFLSRISDADLAQLYRDCRFTLYPSLYEGWGLPITEALCHGKAVITCDNSSLPQAGRGYATFVESGSSTALADAVARFCFEDGELARAEERIAHGFKPRAWREIAGDIVSLVSTLPADAAQARWHEKPIEMGRWYDLTRNDEMRIWRGAASAEIYRMGSGWAVPDERCAWIMPGGASLAIPNAGVAGPCRLIVRLFARRPAGFTMTIDGTRIGDGALAEDEWRWVEIPLHLGMSGTSLLDILPQTVQPEPDIAIGLAGFAICRDEPAGLVDMFEAIAFDRLSDVTAFRETSPSFLSDQTETDVA